MTVTTLSLHRSTDPYGLAGGEAGARGQNRIERADGSIKELAGTDGAEMAPAISSGWKPRAAAATARFPGRNRGRSGQPLA